MKRRINVRKLGSDNLNKLVKFLLIDIKDKLIDFNSRLSPSFLMLDYEPFTIAWGYELISLNAVTKCTIDIGSKIDGKTNTEFEIKFYNDAVQLKISAKLTDEELKKIKEILKGVI